MGGLFGGNNVSTTAPVIGSLQVQTSAFGRTVPWLFGRVRTAPNLIDYNDFTAIPHTTTQRSGKGGGSQSSTEYTYTVSPLMAISSGPVASYGRIWKDKDQTTLAKLGLDAYLGDNAQTPYPYMVSRHPDKALSYRGLAYLAAGSYDLGSSASLGNHTVEVQAAGSIMAKYPGSTVPDAEVADVVTAILTDADQGIGLPADSIFDLSQFRNFCLANNIWVSPVYSDQAEGYEYIKKLMQIGFSDCVYSGGRFKVVPYSDIPASNNLANYVPTIGPVYALNEDDFLGDADTDAVLISRRDPQECYNHVQVKFADRANEYNDNVAESKDDADIELNGLRSMDVVELKEIADANVAQKVAEYLKNRSLHIRNEYEFRLPWKYILLEPMDVVTLTYPRKFLDGTPVLITKIEEDEDGQLTIYAEDFPIGTNKPSLQAPPTIESNTPNFAAEPGNSTVPALFEPPMQLTSNLPQVWLAAAGGPDWGGAQIWVSTDNASYQRVGVLQGASRYGNISAPLAAGGIIDTINVLSVNLAASMGVLNGGTEQNAQDLVTGCYVDGEYIAYANANLTGVNTYDLTYLVRGAYGTEIAAHQANKSFVRLDDGLFKYDYPKDWLGKTIWVKLVSFNKFGGAIQDISRVPAYQYNIEGAPLGAVKNVHLATNWLGVDVRIGWDLLDGADSYDVQILASSPVVIVRNAQAVIGNEYFYSTDDMRADGGPWRQVVFKVRGRANTGKTGPWSQVMANNAQIGALTGLQVDAGIKTGFFQCAAPLDSDFSGILVWIGTTPDVAPIAANLAYDGPGCFVTISRMGDGTALEGNKTYYLRAAGYDTFGKDSLTISPSIGFQALANAPDANTISAGMIKDGALEIAKFAQGIEPVGIVANLNTGLFSGTKTVLNQADGKLYRWDGSAYTKAVTAGDLAADTVTAGTVSAGAINTRELAAGAVTTAKLTVGDMSNLMENPDFTLSGAGWLNDGEWTFASTGGLNGTGVAVYQSAVIRAIRNSYKVKVTAGDAFYAQCSAFLNSRSELCYVRIVGTSAAGVETILANGNNATSGSLVWVKSEVTATVPPNIVSVRADIVAQTPSGVAVSCCGLYRMSGVTLIQDGAITTNKVAALAITGDKIVGNTITGDKILANTITGDKIQAGSVSANVLTSGVGSGNLLYNAAFTATYVSGGNNPADGFVWGSYLVTDQVDVSVDLAGPSWAPPGSRCLVMRQNGTSAPNGYSEIGSVNMTVTASVWYEYSVYSGAHRCNLDLFLYWLNGNGTVIGNTGFIPATRNNQEASGGSALPGFKRLFQVAQAPAGAVMARMMLRKTGTLAPSDSYAFWCQPYLGTATGPNQSQPSPWSPPGIGTQIHGGAIKTSTITADRLAVTSLSAVSGTIGTLSSAASGARFELNTFGLVTYDTNNIDRCRFGYLP